MRRALRVVLLLSGLLTVFVVAVSLGLFFSYRRTVLEEIEPALTAAETYRPPGSVVILDANGKELDAFWKEKRIWISIDDLPEQIPGAIVSSEDQRFFAHGGVDWYGILRAAKANFSGGGVRQGASTLTQQLVKNLVVGKEKTFERKAREAIAAMELERRLSKKQILELYINYVYLGSGNYGIESAARDFFGKPAAELSPAQAALLASTIPAPSRFDPRINKDRAKIRRDRVLRNMVIAGYLDPKDLDTALNEPIVLQTAGVRGDRPGAAYATEVRRLVVKQLGDEAPFALGMKVHTPYREAIQATAQRAITDATRTVMDRQGVWAIVENLRKKEQREAFLAVSASNPKPGDCFHALLEQKEPFVFRTRAGTFSLQRTERRRSVRHRLRMEGRSLPFWGTAKTNDRVRVCLADDGKLTLDDSDWVQGAAVVIDNHTGGVVALVGGNKPVLEGFVRATQALRQPGSSFKPYVYAAALEHGHSQTEVMVDEEITLTAGDGTEWTPGNSGHEEYLGEVPLRTALAVSLNVISVKLVNDVGSDEVARVARRMGVRTPLQEVLSLALGSSEVTVLDQASGYATIANGGVRREPVFVTRIEDREGKLLGRAGGLVVDGDGAPIGELPGKSEQAISPGVAYELAEMLTVVIDRGTGRKGKKKGYFRAGKTGTTNQVTDAWFVGFTPRYTVAVWIGTDDNGSLGSGESGGKTALPAWTAIVDSLPASKEDALDFPDEAMRIRWNGLWVAVNRQTVPRMIFPVRRIGEQPILAYPTPDSRWAKAQQ